MGVFEFFFGAAAGLATGAAIIFFPCLFLYKKISGGVRRRR